MLCLEPRVRGAETAQQSPLGQVRRGAAVWSSPLEDRCAWASLRADLNSGEGRGRRRDALGGALRPRRPGDRARAGPRAAPTQPAAARALRLRGARAVLPGACLPSRLPGAQHHLAAARRPAVDVVAQEPPREARAPGCRLRIPRQRTPVHQPRAAGPAPARLGEPGLAGRRVGVGANALGVRKEPAVGEGAGARRPEGGWEPSTLTPGPQGTDPGGGGRASRRGAPWSHSHLWSCCAGSMNQGFT